ncbi:MAG TPA: methyltransferase [Actinopolymorphaceae bacterium]
MSGQAQHPGATSGAGHRRSVRSALVERLVRDCVDGQCAATGRDSLNVLDAGGGTGTIAVPLAEAGHHVTVVDPSPDSLAALERRASDAGVRERIRAVQGDTAGLLEIAPPGSADVILCHNVLEYVDDPAAALGTLARMITPAGALSVLVANRAALVLAKALTGQLGDAYTLITGDRTIDPQGRFTVEELHSALGAAGFVATATHGVSVFADLLPGTGAGRGPQETRALQALEQVASEHPTFRGLGSQIHVQAALRAA